MTLDELKPGASAEIISVGGEGALRQHLLDMGLIPDARLTMVKLAPMGDPMEICIHNYELTLRLEDAKNIEIREAAPEKEPPELTETQTEHPGLGEGGRYHDKSEEHPLPEGTILTFALAGNQNSGKTTLFNQLTGANQHVGNFPGVTVDRKDGGIKGHSNTLVTDLPGIYSMSPYSSEELITRNFVLQEHPKGIINIADATSIERSLYLTMQLIELDTPMVLALNMMDEVEENGGSILVNEMEEELGIPVVPISAFKNEGIEELTDHLLHVAMYQEKPKRQDFCDKNDHGGAVHRALHGIMHLIEDHAKRAGIPLRFAATKVAEGDQLILEQLGLEENEKEMLEHIVLQMEEERGLDRAAAIADMRFSFIQKLCDKTVIHPKQSKQRTRSEKLDRLFTGKYTAIPCFIVIMFLVFFLTFNVIGKGLQDLMEMGIDSLTKITETALKASHVSPILQGLILDGIFKGVGAVLSFLPLIVCLFFFLSLLEDSGYIARVAFFMDKLLRRIGLSGKSIVPLLMGFGCSVPAIMATRTLPSERDRKMTILLTPFMSCTAKLPIYMFFVDIFFPHYAGLIVTGLYFLGVAIGILAAFIFKETLFKGEAVPFVMELPDYRLPSARTTFQLLWEKAKDFLQRAFTIILVATMIIWFLQSFTPQLTYTTHSQESILAAIAGAIAPVLAPLGLNDWRICTSLISGFMAKESVVSTLEILFTGSIKTILKPLSAACLLVFSLLYTPCVAAITSIRREMGTRWALYVIVVQCTIAWVAAFIVHLIGMALGFG